MESGGVHHISLTVTARVAKTLRPGDEYLLLRLPGNAETGSSTLSVPVARRTYARLGGGLIAVRRAAWDPPIRPACWRPLSHGGGPHRAICFRL